jgi:hypothetical protein
VVAYPMNNLCIVASVRSGSAQKRKGTPGVINAVNFPVTTLTISPWPLARRLFSGLYRIDESSVLKNGFKTKKHAIFVQNAAIKFSGAL